MNNYTEITALDWAILDALSDDYESINLIHEIVSSDTALAPTREDILNRIENLFQRKFIFLTQDQPFDRSALQSEIDDRTTVQLYWFGRTEKGNKAWEQLMNKYNEDTEQNAQPDSQ